MGYVFQKNARQALVLAYVFLLWKKEKEIENKIYIGKKCITTNNIFQNNPHCNYSEATQCVVIVTQLIIAQNRKSLCTWIIAQKEKIKDGI